MLSSLKYRDAKNEEGFTLIELLVVVLIIGILAAIAIPAFLNQRARAWESELTSAVRNVALEIEAEAVQEGGNYTTTSAATATEADALLTETIGTNADLSIVQVAVETGAFCIRGRHALLPGGTTAGAENTITYDTRGAAAGITEIGEACGTT